jgi:hypothetical protein
MSQNRVKYMSAGEWKRSLAAGRASKDGDAVIIKAVETSIVMKEIDRESRIVPFKISTAAVDREGDTIDVAGWDLGNYLKNPVVLFGHDHYQPPVAKSLTTFAENGALKSRAQFTPRDISEFGYMVFLLYAEGYMRATSVGFIPKEWTYAEGDRKGGMDFSRQEMLEYSCVPVPANPEALIEARSLKGIDTTPYRKWAERILDESARFRTPSEDELRSNIERVHALTDLRGRKMVDLLGVVKFDATPAERAKMIAERKDDDEQVLALDDEQHEQSPHTPQTPSNPADIPLHDPDSPEATGTEPNPDANPSDPTIGEDAGKTDENGIKPGTHDGDQDGDKAIKFFGEDPPETIRWNKSLSKRFDVDRAQFQPATAEYSLAAGFIGCELKKLTERNVTIPSAKMGSFLAGLNETLSEANIADTRNLDKDGREYPIQYEFIQLNSRQRSEFLVDGIRFMEWRGQKMTVRVTPTWFGLSVRTFAERGVASETAEALLDETFTRAAGYKFLKGEAFSLSGEFLPRGTGEDMSGLFLSAGNQKAVQRIISLVNEKGAAMDCRGAMFVGPPGTGKTVSCRVMMNSTKSTYIWVSARDLAYSGGFGGIKYAIDLARENSPSIILLEDVDNWMYDSVIDLLKAEMDGLQQHKGIVTVLTTNFPERMPKALIDRPGRFHDILRYDLPDDAVRLRMVRHWMPEVTDSTVVDLIVRETNGYSGAHIRDLARYADTIREQDDISIGDAIVAAIDKMKEQRDIISGSLAAGSRYRAPSFITQRDFARGGVVSFGKGAMTLHGRDYVIPLDMFESLGFSEADVRAAIHDADNAKTPAAVSKSLDALKALREKAGRVLSSKNENALKEVDQMIASASEKLSTVLAQVAKPETEEEAAPKAVEPKTVHVITLDHEREIDVDLAFVEAAVQRVASERLMQLTGRVDFIN